MASARLTGATTVGSLKTRSACIAIAMVWQESQLAMAAAALVGSTTLLPVRRSVKLSRKSDESSLVLTATADETGPAVAELGADPSPAASAAQTSRLKNEI